MTDGGVQMGLAHTAWAQQQDVACLTGPIRGAGQGLELLAGQTGHLGEIEARHALADGQGNPLCAWICTQLWGLRPVS